MNKGIDLSLTKSLIDFDELLERAIGEVSVKKLEEIPDLTEKLQWKFQIGKYVAIRSKEKGIFWIGYGWNESKNREKMLWLEFDAKTSPGKHWEQVKKLVGTSGQYFSKVDIETADVYENTWVHFYLGDEYLKQLFDEKVDIDSQKDILVGFISEIVGKI